MILESLGKVCSNCKAYHDNTYALSHPDAPEIERMCKAFNPDKPCKLCGKPVIAISMGGIDICSWCDCGKDRSQPYGAAEED